MNKEWLLCRNARPTCRNARLTTGLCQPGAIPAPGPFESALGGDADIQGHLVHVRFAPSVREGRSARLSSDRAREYGFMGSDTEYLGAIDMLLRYLN